MSVLTFCCLREFHAPVAVSISISNNTAFKSDSILGLLKITTALLIILPFLANGCFSELLVTVVARNKKKINYVGRLRTEAPSRDA